MIGGLIRFLGPVTLATTAAVYAAFAMYHDASAQAWLLVIVGTAIGVILGTTWVIKHAEQRGDENSEQPATPEQIETPTEPDRTLR